MKKALEIVNKDTGEILEKREFTGGYNITYTNLEDSGELRHIKTLDNGKFDDKHWIKNYHYRPIAIRLTEKFEELEHIDCDLILFIEDTEWTPTGATKQPWIAQVKKANKQLEAMTGYEYVMELRGYYVEKMNREQVVALIYHELRHIDKDGTLRKHDVEDWSNMVATLGVNWATTKAAIEDILNDDFYWGELRKVGKQLNNLKAYCERMGQKYTGQGEESLSEDIKAIEAALNIIEQNHDYGKILKNSFKLLNKINSGIGIGGSGEKLLKDMERLLEEVE